MTKTIQLNFSNLPTFEKTSLFMWNEFDPEMELKRFPNVYQRAIAAMRFCQFIGGDLLPVNDNDREIMNVACLRASLMDFVGMEEVLPIDLLQRNHQETPLKIIETGDVLLILLKELRHLNIHLLNTSFNQEEREAVSYSSIIKPKYCSFPIRVVPVNDLQLLNQLKNAKMYDANQLKLAIEWLDDAQKNWGITEVFQTGIQRYARLIVEAYSSDFRPEHRPA